MVFELSFINSRLSYLLIKFSFVIFNLIMQFDIPDNHWHHIKLTSQGIECCEVLEKEILGEKMQNLFHKWDIQIDYTGNIR